jgi:hypothetical protein
MAEHAPAATPEPLAPLSTRGYAGVVLSLALMGALGFAVSYYSDSSTPDAFLAALSGGAIFGMGAYLAVSRPPVKLHGGLLLALSLAWGFALLMYVGLRATSSFFFLLLWPAAFTGAGLLTTLVGLFGLHLIKPLAAMPWVATAIGGLGWLAGLIIVNTLADPLIRALSIEEPGFQFAVAGFLVGLVGGAVMLWQLNRVRAQLANSK